MQSFLQSVQHLLHVSCQERFTVQAEAWEDARTQEAIPSRGEELISASHQHVPAHLLLIQQDGHIFRDTGRLVQSQFGMQIIGGTRNANFSEQLRATAVKPPADRDSGRSEPRGTFALVLLPQTRSGGPLPAIALLPGAERADFQLQLESDDFPAYQVALKDLATTRIIWRSGRLKAASVGAAVV